MSFCATCLCPLEMLEQPDPLGWRHACDHDHKCAFIVTISERQREQRLAAA